MRKYEIMYILNPESNDIKALQNKLHAILENNGSKIEEISDWGVMELAYPIKKRKKGHYTVLIVNTTAQNVDEFVRISHIEPDVLRILVINTEKEKGYLQSTKYAKTEVKNDKAERNDRKTVGKKFEKKWDQPDNNQQPAESENPVKKDQ